MANPANTYEITNPAWYVWLSNKRAHTCSCGHVQWAHWPNGICAHCKCERCDADPVPPVRLTVEVVPTNPQVS